MSSGVWFVAALLTMVPPPFLKPLDTQRVILTLESHNVEQTLKTLGAQGVQFETRAAEVLHIGRLYGALVPTPLLTQLARTPGVLAVADARPRGPLPSWSPGDFGYVPQLLGAPPLHRLRDADNQPLRGKGITYCDMDRGMDVFHPLLFRPDAGFYAWLDANADGLLTLGTDAVDLNANGAVDAGEVLELLPGAVWGNDSVPSTLVVGQGFLYADTNHNNRRDFGASFDDATPAFGEPLFVVDDVNQDGLLSVGEKLVRLGSSKIKAVIYLWDGSVYERGQNLSQTPRSDLDEQDHALGVATVLLGGDPRYTNVYGMAPDAELVVIERTLPEDAESFALSPPGAAAIANTYNPHIYIHEYGWRSDEFRDGSGPYEELVDTLAEAGYAQAVPAHNFAYAPTEQRVVVPAGETVNITALVDALYPPYLLEWTFRHQDGAGHDLSILFTAPDGQEIDFTNPPSTYTYSTFFRQTSLANTHMVYAASYRTNAAVTQFAWHEGGTWTIALSNSGSSDITVYVTTGDESGYGTAHILSQGDSHGSQSNVASANLGIVVGASVANFPGINEVPLGLTNFSGRGPRIDGAQVIDVVAPHDHYGGVSDALGEGIKHGDYQVFGGTSGATPAFASVLGLLWQYQPNLTVPQLRTLVRERGIQDTLTGELPNQPWGYGRLDGYQLVTGEQAPTEPLPLGITFEPSEVSVTRDQPVTLAATVTPNSAASLLWSWDVDYDGVADFDSANALTFTPTSSQWVKVTIEDTEQHRTASALVQVTVTRAPRVPRNLPAGTTDGCSCRDTHPGAAWVLGLFALLATRIRRATG